MSGSEIEVRVRLWGCSAAVVAIAVDLLIAAGEPKSGSGATAVQRLNIASRAMLSRRM